MLPVATAWSSSDGVLIAIRYVRGWVSEGVPPPSEDETGRGLCPLPRKFSSFLCLQCFDAVGWAAGRASGL